MSDFADSAAARSTAEARFEAQRIAFGPIAFQAARVLRDTGILEALRRARRRGGLDFDELTASVDLPPYGVRVLVEAGLGVGLLADEDGRYTLTKTGFFVLRDKLTRVNMDFVQHCCYEAANHLEASVREGRPAGLSAFGDWGTVYPGVQSLPDEARDSWLAFDHHYSDSAFPAAIEQVLAAAPKRILDIGGNTGRFALECVRGSETVAVTIVDLPSVLEHTRRNLAAAGAVSRVDTLPANLLDPSVPLPRGFDTLWMSQFLVCFSEDEAVSLLRRAADAMDEEATLYILDTCWDTQDWDAARYSLQAISLYFTFLANGNSRMYKATDIERFVAAAGLEVARRTDGLGICHSLFECRRS